MSKKVMREHMRERFGSAEAYVMHPPLPNSLNIELNNYCNQKCEFCGYHGKYASTHMTPSDLKIDFVKRILDQAWELGIGKKEVGFYLSGEAFLYKQLPEVISYAKKLGFEYTFLTTNGALANHEMMKKVVDAGLNSIRFSVNAADREMYKAIHGTDDFDKVVDNIRFLDEYRKNNNIEIATSLSCVVSKKNKDGLQEGIKKVFGDVVDDILFIPVMLYRLKNMKEVREIHELINDDNAEIDSSYICSILFNTMYISSDGYAIPCCNAPHFKYNIFDLNQELDLKKAWYSEGYEKLRSIFVEGGEDKGTMCEDCLLRRKGANRLSYEEEL